MGKLGQLFHSNDEFGKHVGVPLPPDVMRFYEVGSSGYDMGVLAEEVEVAILTFGSCFESSIF